MNRLENAMYLSIPHSWARVSHSAAQASLESGLLALYLTLGSRERPFVTFSRCVYTLNLVLAALT